MRIVEGIGAMRPNYDLDAIRFATDGPTFKRAIDLYEAGKVTEFKRSLSGHSAIVLGTKPYRVYVSGKEYDRANCTCYLGQNDTLCKHAVAVAIRAVTGGASLSEEDRQQVGVPQCSGRMGTITSDELMETRVAITAAMRLIAPYNGPSRIWFAYQNKLQEGCARLSAIVSTLPVSRQTTQLLITLLLRLDRKLSSGGVDDSDGTVGNFMSGAVEMLEGFVSRDPSCIREFRVLCGRETCFGWEESLVRLFDEQH